MKYNNVIIKCSKDYSEELQKYLFRLKYYYFVRGIKSRNIIDNVDNDFCIIIKNDRTLTWQNENFSKHINYLSSYRNLKIINYPICLREDKLNKINKKA
jgi:hypothetical protein